MKVEIVSRKLIKPSIPTPSNLRTLKISYLDQIAHPINACFTLYYPNATSSERLNRLEESLSEVLTLFYPLAGRYNKENYTVECNDQGAEFIQAQADFNLLKTINRSNVKPEDLYDFLPRDCPTNDEITNPLLAVQVTKFTCGGVAICVSISHRIFDIASVDTFISAWMWTNRGDNTNQEIFPAFNAHLLFPSKNIASRDFEIAGKIESTVIARRFSFDKKVLSSLRDTITTSKKSGKHPLITRTQLVCALVVKAFARTNQKKYGQSRDLLVLQAIDIRGRTIPPISKYACGNIALPSVTESTTEQCQNMGYLELVHLLSDSITKTLANCVDPQKTGHTIDTIMELTERTYKNDMVALFFTNLTKFSFYDADFGWGKPVWVTPPNTFTKNFVLLLDNKMTGGIEAWVHLDEKDMHCFGEDEEIKLFTNYSGEQFKHRFISSSL